jgi:hypothetical protein
MTMFEENDKMILHLTSSSISSINIFVDSCKNSDCYISIIEFNASEQRSSTRKTIVSITSISTYSVGPKKKHVHFYFSYIYINYLKKSYLYLL